MPPKLLKLQMNKRKLRKLLRKNYKKFLKENRDLARLAETYLTKLRKKYNLSEEQLYYTLYDQGYYKHLSDDGELFLKHLLFILDTNNKVPPVSKQDSWGPPQKNISLIVEVAKWAKEQVPSWVSINLGISLTDTINKLKKEYSLSEEEIVMYTIDSLLTDMLENPFKYEDAYKMESIISDSIF